jgi:hypothetical protein
MGTFVRRGVANLTFFNAYAALRRAAIGAIVFQAFSDAQAVTLVINVLD